LILTDHGTKPTNSHTTTPIMSDQSASRFTPQNKSAQERLSDFRKRRAEVLEQQERESREAAQQTTGPSTPGTTSAPDSDTAAASDGAQPVRKKVKKKKKKPGKKLLSFDDEEDGEEDGSQDKDHAEDASAGEKKQQANIQANAAAGIVPKTMTTYALRKEAAEREALRREFLAIQAAVKATEIAIPFVFYDGANIPGGTVRVKKGDFVWVFLDKSRKVGAELGVGENANAMRMWARVGVDDLMLVRGTLIIPHVCLMLPSL
jgi:protein FAM50